MLTIGIDFGTTNCSAAVLRGGRIELIPLEEGNTVLPSMLCITREGEILFGRSAIRRYLELMRHSPIHYKFTDLRALTSAYQREIASEEVISSENNAVFVSADSVDDNNVPARLFQSLKTGLRDLTLAGTMVYDKYYAIEELIALVLRHIREQAEAYLGEPVRAAIIGRPVTYAHANAVNGDAEHIDRTAHERMLAAAHLAGLEYAGIEFEPVAALRHLRSYMPQGGIALVFDFGGGTLDLALANVPPQGTPEILAARGMLIGGDDFDSAIMQHFILPHFGADTTLTEKQLPFPPTLLDPLCHWQTIPMLTTPLNAARLLEVQRQSNNPQAVTNLITLVQQGLGFELFREIEASKIRLSEVSETDFDFDERGLVITERLTRRRFVSAIGEYLEHIERELRRMLLSTGITAEHIDRVLMTGGSSLVPIVQMLVRRLAGTDKVMVADPFSSIAAGLAYVAVEDDMLQPVADVISSATAQRLEAERVTLGETVEFDRGQQKVRGLVVRRADGRMHDAILVIEFWDAEIEEFVSTMRHETKVRRLAPRE
ncbi:MAG: Hsp70 family protein [Chloroflexi bacterium]|nr:Hsp70 family protein [Chloroflexota bacterium]